MAQCQGKTKKGDRCKRDASDTSDFCSIHQDQEVRPRSEPSGEWDTESITKAALGVALLGIIILFRFRR